MDALIWSLMQQLKIKNNFLNNKMSSYKKYNIKNQL